MGLPRLCLRKGGIKQTFLVSEMLCCYYYWRVGVKFCVVASHYRFSELQSVLDGHEASSMICVSSFSVVWAMRFIAAPIVVPSSDTYSSYDFHLRSGSADVATMFVCLTVL